MESGKNKQIGRALLRFLIALLGAGLGVGLLAGIDGLLRLVGLVNLSLLLPSVQLVIYIVAAVAFGILFYFLSPAIIRFFQKAVSHLEKTLFDIPMLELLSATGGLIIGLLIAFLLSRLVEMIPIAPVSVSISVILYLTLAYLGWTVGRKRWSFRILCFRSCAMWPIPPIPSSATAAAGGWIF